MATAHTETRTKKTAAKASPDAIALLKADHREVEGWFEEFEGTNSDSKKQKLADKICTALKVHTAFDSLRENPRFKALIARTGVKE